MTPSYEINRAEHQRRLRERLELLGEPGPVLPGERPQRIVCPRTGAVRVWSDSAGTWIGID